jgi:hypothetical protein
VRILAGGSGRPWYQEMNALSLRVLLASLLRPLDQTQRTTDRSLSDHGGEKMPKGWSNVGVLQSCGIITNRSWSSTGEALPTGRRKTAAERILRRLEAVACDVSPQNLSNPRPCVMEGRAPGGSDHTSPGLVR